MSTQKPASSGPPLRALAMVLIALAILFAGLGFASLGTSSSDTAAPSATTTATTTSAATVAGGSASTRSAPSSTPSTTSGSATATTTSSAATTSLSAAEKSAISVRVFNNSNVTGLAGRTASGLTESGWTVAETGNYNAGTIPTTTVYYGDGAAEEQAASAIAAELGVTAEPRFPGIANSPPGVIVIVTNAG